MLTPHGTTVREHVLGRANDTILEPVGLVIISGEPQLSGAALARQLQLGHSAWITFGPGFHLFNGLNEVSADGDTGSYYWLLYLPDPNPTDPGHWLRTATREEKYEYVLKKIGGIDEKFQEGVKAGGAEVISDNFSLYYDAVIESLPVSRVTLLGDAAHPLTPCESYSPLSDVIPLFGQ